jgi:urea transport system ATP-binding protein
MLQVSGLKVSYGQSEVIGDLSFDVGDTEALAVMGRNGMGKTTLMKSLMGILSSRKGSVKLDGKELAGLESWERVEAGLAFVPQGRMIFSTLTVEENILTGLETSGGRTVPDDIYGLFPVLHEMRRRKGGNLSGGQQQQLAIARALLGRPKVLLLDEPTEGIQPSIIDDIERVLLGLKQKGGIAILLVEQYLDFARRLGDSYSIMERGCVVRSGVTSELTDEIVKRHLAF